MDYCKSCGSEVAAGTRRCPSCGDVIDEFASEKSGGVSEEVLHREVMDLVRRDGVITGIKRYREATGCDLKTAKDAVERLMAGGALDPIKPQPGVETLEAEIIELAQGQSKIAAIKRYREGTGCGLKDAKDAVDALLQQHGIQAKGGSGCAGVVLLGLAFGWGLWLVV
ncbi:MAG: ribosomal protein L7/L12 [Planctomycetaceae bacterium]